MRRSKVPPPIVGERINKLTVIEVCTARYRVQCDCGKVRDFPPGRLARFWQPRMPKDAHIKSCGDSCKLMLEELRNRKRKHGASSKDVFARHWMRARLSAIFQRCANEKDHSHPRYGGLGVRCHEQWRSDYQSFLLDCKAFPDPGEEPHWYAIETVAISDARKQAVTFYEWFRGQEGADERIATAQDVHDWLLDPNGGADHHVNPLSVRNPFWKLWSVDRIHNEVVVGRENRDPAMVPGNYEPGNVRLLARGAQALNRRRVAQYKGVPLPTAAREAGIDPRTAAARQRNGDADPLRPLESMTRPEADRAIAAALARGVLGVSRDGRVVEYRDGVPVAKFPSFSAEGRYLCLDLPRKLCREFGVANSQVSMHRVVAIAFHGTPPTTEHLVDHCDGVRAHNAASNLRWATSKENANTKRKARTGYTEAEQQEHDKWVRYYKDPANYRDLFPEAVRQPRTAFVPPRLLPLEEDDRLLATAVESPSVGWLKGQSRTDFLRKILAAPGNDARLEANGDVTLLVVRSGGERRIGIEDLSKTDSPRVGCHECGYELPDLRNSIDNLDAYQFRPLMGSCIWCRSVAIKNPDLAAYFAEGEPGGESPFRVTSGTHKRYRMWCRNHGPTFGCTSPPVLANPRGRTKPPICPSCRAKERPANLGKNARTRTLVPVLPHAPTGGS